MHFGLAKLVGPDDWPDQKHRSAGRANQTGHQRADQNQYGVEQRGSFQRTAQDDAAGDDEQPSQQDDERDIVDDINVQRSVKR